MRGGDEERQAREERAAGRQDVVDEEDPFARADREAAPELAPLGAVRAGDLLGEDAARAELARDLEGEDDTARGGAGDEVDDREAWPAQLQGLLGRRVVNGGVTGYGLDQMVLRAERFVALGREHGMEALRVKVDRAKTQARLLYIYGDRTL